jgi:hypothetical protein
VRAPCLTGEEAVAAVESAVQRRVLLYKEPRVPLAKLSFR